MTSYGTASSVPAATDEPVTLDLLGSTATGALTTHLNDAGLYVIGGYAWPCQRAMLTDHTVVAL
jgi:hypothetical protein